jgi:PAS domain S-box-containing protein
LITDEVKSRHALAESEARFRATFENVAVGISHIAPDGAYVRFNKVLPRLLGWPADELITKSVWEITHPDDLGFELAEFSQLETGRCDSYSVEKRGLRKDGTTVWIRRTVSSVRRIDGSIDYFGAVTEDISARKRAEEQIRLVMREAKHRVKNLLGLVQVIARRTELAMLRVSSNASPIVSRRSPQIRICSIGTSGVPPNLTTWYTPNSRILQISSGRGSRCTVRSCI